MLNASWLVKIWACMLLSYVLLKTYESIDRQKQKAGYRAATSPSPAPVRRNGSSFETYLPPSSWDAAAHKATVILLRFVRFSTSSPVFPLSDKTLNDFKIGTAFDVQPPKIILKELVLSPPMRNTHSAATGRVRFFPSFLFYIGAL